MIKNGKDIKKIEERKEWLREKKKKKIDWSVDRLIYSYILRKFLKVISDFR